MRGFIFDSRDLNDTAIEVVRKGDLIGDRADDMEASVPILSRPVVQDAE